MKIGLIGAMDKEIEEFIKIFNFSKIDNSNIYYAKYYDKELYLVKSGIGKVNAALTTQRLIDIYDIDLIINSGCAGGLIDDLNVMDMILVDSLTYHDFKPNRIMEMSVPDNGNIITDKYLNNKILDILKKNDISNYKIGKMCSGDCFVTDKDMRDRIHDETNAIAVDMESTSIAHTARLNNIPFAIIRTISDFADGTVEKEKVAADRACFIVYKLIDELD